MLLLSCKPQAAMVIPPASPILWTQHKADRTEPSHQHPKLFAFEQHFIKRRGAHETCHISRPPLLDRTGRGLAAAAASLCFSLPSTLSPSPHPPWPHPPAFMVLATCARRALLPGTPGTACRPPHHLPIHPFRSQGCMPLTPCICAGAGTLLP